MKFLPDGGRAVACESGATMQRRPRRNHTPAFKANVALAAVKRAGLKKSERDDKWSFCLTAGTLCPANQEKQ